MLFQTRYNKKIKTQPLAILIQMMYYATITANRGYQGSSYRDLFDAHVS
ncbi:hypothetical protein KBB89_01585 [Candidatus Gracilibacteria bacterium]|nr:hypothetical protein [Candidatus Gracilibacteria bacterium]